MLHYDPVMKGLLISTGAVVLLDDEDYEIMRHFRWRQTPEGHVYRVVPNGPAYLYLHSMLMEPHAPFWVVHRDHNPLNCQKDNLVLCTPTESAAHRQDFAIRYAKAALRRKRPGPAARYIGVRQNGDRRFLAAINPRRGNRIHLGTFTTPEAAALAYNAACRLLFPEGTRYLNDVPFADYPEFTSPRFLRKMERLRAEK
jgi:hypothetical protein